MAGRLATATRIIGLALAITVALILVAGSSSAGAFEELAKQFSVLQVCNSRFTDGQQLADRYRPYVSTTRESCTSDHVSLGCFWRMS